MDLGKIVERSLAALYHELKYTIDISLHKEGKLEVACVERELAYVIQTLIRRTFRRIEGKGRLHIDLRDEGDHCIFNVTGYSAREGDQAAKGAAEPEDEFSLAFDIAERNGWNVEKGENRNRYRMSIPKESTSR